MILFKEHYRSTEFIIFVRHLDIMVYVSESVTMSKVDTFRAERSLNHRKVISAFQAFGLKIKTIMNL